MLSANELLRNKIGTFSSRVMELQNNLDIEKENALFELIRRQALIESGLEERFDVSEPNISLQTKLSINSLSKELKVTQEIYNALLLFQSKIKSQDLNRLEEQWLEEINNICTW